MAWAVEVKTTQGDHTMRFEKKDEAEAALAEVEAAIGMVAGQSVKIADQLVVIGSQITSGKMWESAY